jgi:hypothetical protein
VTSTAIWTAAAWLLLCFFAANVWVAVALYRKAGEFDRRNYDLDVRHLRLMAFARILDMQAQRQGDAANEPIREVRS